MDAAAAQIVDGLAAANDLDDTLIVVTADHGEGFGERSRIRPEARIVGHGNGGLPECILHVPLVVKYPNQKEPAASDAVTSLTEFPSAVRTVQDESAGTDAFLPDEEPVVCATAGVDPDTSERAREYLNSVNPYDKAGQAVYETTDDGTVLKRSRWGDSSGTVHVKNSQAAWLESDTAAGDIVASVIEDLVDAGVRDSTRENVDDEVKRRLEELGYA
jgi:arylsulfatase